MHSYFVSPEDNWELGTKPVPETMPPSAPRIQASHGPKETSGPFQRQHPTFHGQQDCQIQK